MHARFGLGWLLLGLLAAPTALAQGKSLQPGQVVWNVASIAPSDRAAATALDAAAWRALQAGDGTAARNLLVAAESTPLTQHWALHQLLQRLQAAAPMPAAEPLLAYAAAQPVRVLRQHEETAATWLLAQFDPAASAADVRRAWAIAIRRDALLASMAKATSPPSLPADADGLGRAALIAAIEAVPASTASRFAEDAAKHLLPADVALALARRSGDRELAASLLQHAEPAVRLAAFEQLLPDFAEDERRDWLQRLEADHELASAATLALVPVLAEADDLAALLRRLDDAQRGPSTAAGLAKLDDALQRIEVLWMQASTERQQRMLLLALQLIDSEASRARRDERLAERGEVQR
jgi:hypothetical protein